MQTRYGHAKVSFGDGREFFIVPSLCNISKIGSPREIVSTVKSLGDTYDIAQAYLSACLILDACGLPQDVTGGIDYSERQKKWLMSPGSIPVDDVFTLAWHCVKHGISGASDSEEAGEPIEEFNADQLIMIAVEHLGLSLSEAESLTMTQFCLLASAKHSGQGDQNKEPVITKKEEDDLLAWHAEKARKIKEQSGVTNGV